eukprot:jgi/Bigna1/139922/aug1.53_g14630
MVGNRLLFNPTGVAKPPPTDARGMEVENEDQKHLEVDGSKGGSSGLKSANKEEGVLAAYVPLHCQFCPGKLEGGDKHFDHPIHGTNVERHNRGLGGLTGSDYRRRMEKGENMLDIIELSEKSSSSSMSVSSDETGATDRYDDTEAEEWESSSEQSVNSKMMMEGQVAAIGDGEWVQAVTPSAQSKRRGGGKQPERENKQFYLWTDPLTRKSFKSEQTYRSYVQSGKYRKILRKGKLEMPPDPYITLRENPADIRYRQQERNLNSKPVDPTEWNLSKFNPLECPIDSHESNTLEEAVSYLEDKYDIRIPYRHRLRNLHGFLCYLVAKVSEGHFPLSVSAVNRRPSRFKSKKACQEHMQAKKDFGFKFKGNEEEYYRFYDVRGMARDMEIEPRTELADNGRDLVVVHPDGTRQLIKSKKTRKMEKLRNINIDIPLPQSDSENVDLGAWKKLSKQEKSLKFLTERERDKRRNDNIRVSVKNNKVFDLPR